MPERHRCHVAQAKHANGNQPRLSAQPSPTRVASMHLNQSLLLQYSILAKSGLSSRLSSKASNSKKFSSSQLISNGRRLVQRRHSHNLHHQARPSSKVLRALASACLGVVLLPSEARLLPALEYSVDQIRAQLVVQAPSLALEGPLLGSDSLWIELASKSWAAGASCPS